MSKMHTRRIIPYLLLGCLCLSLFLYPLTVSTKPELQTHTTHNDDEHDASDTLRETRKGQREHAEKRRDVQKNGAFKEHQEEVGDTRLFSASDSDLTKFENDGWSWRPPAIINKTDARFQQEYYNDTTGTWDFTQVTENVTATGQDIEIVKGASEGIFHIFVANKTKKIRSEYDYWHVDDVKLFTNDTTLEFADTFDDGDLGNNWTLSGSGEVGVSMQTYNSSSYSLYLRSRAVTATSKPINLTFFTYANISLWIRRGANTFSEYPESGDDLVIEYNNSSGNWKELDTYLGGGIPGEEDSLNNVSLPEDANHSHFRLRFRKTGGNCSQYYEIQHWIANYTDLNGTGERKVRPRMHLSSKLSAANVSGNKLMSFVDMSAEAVWDDDILLSYLLLERDESNNNLTATLYTRFLNGTRWEAPEDIVSTPTGVNIEGYPRPTEVMNVKDLTIWYNLKADTIFTSFLARLQTKRTFTGTKIRYDEVYLFVGNLTRGKKKFNISRATIESPSFEDVPKYRIGPPIHYNSTSSELFYPRLNLSGVTLRVSVMSVNLTDNSSALLAKLTDLSLSSSDVRLGNIDGTYYQKNSSSCYIPVSWTIYYQESTSKLWLGSFLVDEKKGTVTKEKMALLSQYNPGRSQIINQTQNETYLFYQDLSYPSQEVSFTPFNATNITDRLKSRATCTETATIQFDVGFARNAKLKGSFLVAHIAYREVNGVTMPVALLTPGFNDTDRDGLGNIEETVYYESQYGKLNETNPDSDSDNLTDGSEVFYYKTNASNDDTDSDRLDDFEELTKGSDGYITNASNNDTDGEGLGDWAEYSNATNPLVNDTDCDALNDAEEVLTYGSNASNPDTDGDDLTDYDEVVTYVAYGCDLTRNDTDGDNLTDYEEIRSYETMCNDSDTDDDGLNDFDEVKTYGTNPTDPDTEGDGLNDSEEIEIYGTNPKNDDTDGDRLNDSEEVTTYATDPTKSDTDDDGLNDYNEIHVYHQEYGCNATKNDTDEDNLTDYTEVKVYRSLCNKSDTDDDGLNDTVEANVYETSLTSNDTDADGLSDYAEIKTYGTNPKSDDTDGDGIKDSEEVTTYATDPTKSDTDDDGLNDYDELYTYPQEYGCNATKNDTDRDGLSDYAEIKVHNTMCNETDTDDDGLDDYEEVTEHRTDPTKDDTDGDNLNDSAEIHVHLTDPLSIDTDGDNLNDTAELFIYGTNASNPDTDGDELTDYEELFTFAEYGCLVTDNDTDDDNLTDYEEVKVYGSMCNMTDTDGDHLTDYEEAMHGTDPTTVEDTDGDGLSDYEEVTEHGTDPTLGDTDGDGLSDYEEVKEYGTDPKDRDMDDDHLSDFDELIKYPEYGCNVTRNDTDYDGLTDYEEIMVHGTMCNDTDTDDDGLSDYQEAIEEKSSPLLNDTDDDGLNDFQEVNTYQTDPTKSDSDGDGLDDYTEVEAHDTDPNDPDSDDDKLTDYEEVVLHGTDPNNHDSDGDGLWDGEEIEMGLNPNSKDSDGDFIPDTYEHYIPLLAETPVWWILLAVVAILSLVYAWNYGLFKRAKVSTAGMNDAGGTLMFALNPEKIAEEVDPHLFASSLTGSFSLLQENLGVEQEYVIMGKRPQLIISKQDETYFWAQVKEAFPKVIKKVTEVHTRAVNKYADEIRGGVVDTRKLEPVQEFVEKNLPLVGKEKREDEHKVDEDEEEEHKEEALTEDEGMEVLEKEDISKEEGEEALEELEEIEELDLEDEEEQ